MKLDNKIFIERTKIDDIPWGQLEGPYERGNEFPNWILSLKSENITTVNAAKKNIRLNFEHQETLWSVTPFVMLMLQKTLKETKNPITIVAILELYEIIYYGLSFQMKIYERKQFPLFSDLLKKNNLFPPLSTSKDNYYDNEEALSEEYYENMSKELFISFYYYSWLILAYSIKYDFPKLNEIQDTSVKEMLKKFENNSINLFLNDLLIKDNLI